MSYKPGDTIYAAFSVQVPSTGAAVDADALPTAKCWRNGADSGEVVAVADDAGLGQYTGSVAIPGDWSDGDTVEIRAVAIQGGVTSPPTPVFHGVLDTKRNTDLVVPDAAGVAAGLHGTTDGLIGALVVPDASGTAAGLHATTDGLVGGLVVPDAAGTAAGLHVTTDALVAALNDPTTAAIVTAVWAAAARTITGTVTTDAASRTASKADVSALALEATVDAVNTLATWLKNVKEGDKTIDISGTPYELVVKIKDAATELVRKKLYKVDAVAVSSTDHIVGQELETAP